MPRSEACVLPEEGLIAVASSRQEAEVVPAQQEPIVPIRERVSDIGPIAEWIMLREVNRKRPSQSD